MGLPRLVFVNKMDREGASMSRVLAGMNGKGRGLKGWGIPVVLHWPVVLSDERNVRGAGSGGPSFKAVFDLVEGRICDFSKHKSGSVVEYYDLDTYQQGLNQKELLFFKAFATEVKEAKERMIDQLCEINDSFLQSFMDCDMDYSKIGPELINAAVRRLTLDGSIVPVLCGSAYRNIGVQLLLTSIVSYLSSPTERPLPVLYSKTQYGLANIGIKLNTLPMKRSGIIALAFKIINDPNRGPIVFIRVYKGTLHSKSKIWNATRGLYERVGQCLKLFGGEVENIPELCEGDIGAVSGLSGTFTGDTLSSYGLLPRDTDKQDWCDRDVVLENIKVGTPVISCTIKPVLSSSEDKFLKALNGAVKEDPSLCYKTTESGDVCLSGLGQLHLETSIEKMQADVKGGIERGVVRVEYRESAVFEESCTVDFVYDEELFGKRVYARVCLEMGQIRTDNESDELILDVPSIKEGGGNTIVFSDEFMHDSGEDVQPYKDAIREGILGGLSRGKFGVPVTNIAVRVYDIGLDKSHSSFSSVRSASFKCIEKSLRIGQSYLLEPVMRMNVCVPKSYIGAVSKDITGSLQGVILNMVDESADDDMENIDARASLRNLVDYSSKLRSITKGTGMITMELEGYQSVRSDQVASIVKELRGF